MHITMKSIQNELIKKAESDENFARDIIESLITKQDIENLPTRVVTVRMCGDLLEIYMDNVSSPLHIAHMRRSRKNHCCGKKSRYL